MLAVCLPVIFFINFLVAQLAAGEKFYLRFYFPNHLYFFYVYVLYGVVFFFIRYSYEKELSGKELLIQSRQSELSFLRLQINPHFLFNSLNTIYSLVYHQSSKALPTIAGLSELLRYTLYEATEKVPLEKEIIYISKYIELQKLRFDEPIHVDMEVIGDISNVSIPPFLFIPFVENAFKHGRFRAEKDRLRILLKSTAGNITFECSNKIGHQQKDASGGIGTDNVKKRLQLLYPGKHSLQIVQNGDQFTVKLDITYE
jgi:LytS/YehU family sensor histidine kinase